MMQYPTHVDEDMETLQRRLSEAMRALENKHNRLAAELRVAAKVHASLLPRPVRHERIAIDLRYLPVEEVGGDYCQMRFPDPTTCYITVCDVTGHGIGPALLATRASSEVLRDIIHRRTPRAIIRSLNRFIGEHFAGTDLYLTFMATRIDFARSQITFSGAGHPCPLLIRRQGRTVQRLDSQNQMIGIVEHGWTKTVENTLPLERGDRLLFYTDGLTETVDAAGRFLGTGGLAEIAVEAMAVDLFEMADYILDQVTQQQHGPATDDTTLIVAEIR